MKETPEDRLNMNIYKQNSYSHRNHLLDIIKRKELKKPKAKTRVISYKPSASDQFKVGYAGRVKDIYDNNPNTFLNEVLEEKARKRQKRRDSLYKVSSKKSLMQLR